jgi:hypothetical protein
MRTTPISHVFADPGTERVVIAASRVDLDVDGRAVAALVRVTWLPKPPRTAWLALTAGATFAVAGAFVLWRRVAASRVAAAVVVVVGAVGAFIGQGGSGARQGIAAVLIAACVVASFVRPRWTLAVAAAAVTIIAVSRLEVFEHRLVAGPLAGAWQRVGVTTAIAGAGGVALAAVVAALTPASSPSDSSASGPIPGHQR